MRDEEPLLYMDKPRRNHLLTYSLTYLLRDLIFYLYSCNITCDIRDRADVLE